MGYNVLILGCGPAGLIAAQAAATNPQVDNVRILSRGPRDVARKSFMNGAQYLHEPTPGIPAEQFQLRYELRGEVAGYRAKVYGPMWDGVVSPEDFVGTHTAWDIRATYDALWDIYRDYIRPYDVTPAGLRQTLENLKPDLTVSTVPAPLLCAEAHQFGSVSCWAADRAIIPVDSNTVVCNGDPEVGWYRVSNIAGYENTEWPEHRRAPVSPIWNVSKPTKTNCDCFPEVVRTGRYGKWQKGVLSHSAWEDTVKAIAGIDK